MTLPDETRAVVTGAGSGLGRAFALELAGRGGQVVVSDIDPARAEQTASEISAAGGTAVALRCDVADLAQVQALSQQAEDRFGGVDLVINNAGVAVGGPLDQIDIEDWKWIVDVNLWGVIHGCHVFYPAMKQRGSGYIVNIASAAGLLAPPDLGPYNTTKAAVVALSETLHAEARAHGVNVTVVCPTFFRTRIMDAAHGPIDEAERRVVDRLMDRSRVQADGVARAALDAVGRNRLYAVPMTDGQMFWRIKRLVPGRFYDAAGAVQQAVKSRLGR